MVLPTFRACRVGARDNAVREATLGKVLLAGHRREEIEAATRVLESRSLWRYCGIQFPEEAQNFEAEFASFVGTKHALAVSSGSAALATALSALAVGPGQEVIIPAYMWVSVVAAVVNQGAIPVLADIDETFGLNPASVVAQITERTAGIIMVHMSGAPADVPAIRRIARERNLWLDMKIILCTILTIFSTRTGGKPIGVPETTGIAGTRE